MFTRVKHFQALGKNITRLLSDEGIVVTISSQLFSFFRTQRNIHIGYVTVEKEGQRVSENEEKRRRNAFLKYCEHVRSIIKATIVKETIEPIEWLQRECITTLSTQISEFNLKKIFYYSTFLYYQSKLKALCLPPDISEIRALIFKRMTPGKMNVVKEYRKFTMTLKKLYLYFQLDNLDDKRALLHKLIQSYTEPARQWRVLFSRLVEGTQAFIIPAMIAGIAFALFSSAMIAGSVAMIVLVTAAALISGVLYSYYRYTERSHHVKLGAVLEQLFNAESHAPAAPAKRKSTVKVQSVAKSQCAFNQSL